MLPQQTLMLQVAAEAIADAGWDDRPRLRSGVVIGLGLDQNATNFHVRWSMLNAAREWNRALELGLSDAELEAWTQELRDAFGPPLTANRTMGALGGLVGAILALPVAEAGLRVFASIRARRGRTRAPFSFAALALLLNIMQPIARLFGRLRCGLSPWRGAAPLGVAAPIWTRFALWTERWRPPESRLMSVRRFLTNSGLRVIDGGEYDRCLMGPRRGVSPLLRRRARQARTQPSKYRLLRARGPGANSRRRKARDP